MDAINDVFVQYMIYLEKEQDVKTAIITAVKPLETITYAITLQMERMHNNVDEQSIQRTCELINKELLKAKDAYKELAQVLPTNQFYRYNFMFRNQTQKIIQATALLVYLKENRLVKLDEVASLLGLKSFEASMQVPGDDTTEGMADTDPSVLTGMEEPIKFSTAVTSLAVSCSGTQLILTPSSPRPRNSSTSSTISDDFLPSGPAGDSSYSRALAQDSADPDPVFGMSTPLETSLESTQGDAANPNAAEGAAESSEKKTGVVASEKTKAGASEKTKAVASEKTKAGASEKTKAGASEKTKAGASGKTKAGASEKTKAGASEKTTEAEAFKKPVCEKTDATVPEKGDASAEPSVTCTAESAQVPAPGTSKAMVPAVTLSEDDSAKVLHLRSRCKSVNCDRGPHRAALPLSAGAGVVLYLDIEDFLIGCLMIGSELARLAVNAVSTGNFGLPFCINQFLRELHAGYTQLHLKNSFLRKTYDELKYSLKKTEDVVYNLSLRGMKPVDAERRQAVKQQSSNSEVVVEEESMKGLHVEEEDK